MSHVVYKKSGFKFFSPTKNRCENHIHKSWVLGIQKPLYNVCFSETDGDIKIISLNLNSEFNPNGFKYSKF